MEFYKNAIEIRKKLMVWMLRDFNTKRNVKSLRITAKEISKEDKETIQKILEKYGVKVNKEFQTEFPEWFVDDERKAFCKLLRKLILSIVKANSIFPTNDEERQKRRNKQNKAIYLCYCLYSELHHIISMFKVDLNKMVPILDDIEREVELLRGWRKSNNKKGKTC